MTGHSKVALRFNQPVGRAGSKFEDRAERLRRGRAAAPSLREMAPSTTHVVVRLEFRSDGTLKHADQSIVLYPGARAYFGFPCPYGDCDGIYDLTRAAQSAMTHLSSHPTETLQCEGTRSRHRLLGPCGLQLSYTVSAEHGANFPR